MITLPLELIRQIIEDIIHDVDYWIYRRDLFAVALSCRFLRHEAQRVLFRDPGVLYTTTAARRKTFMFLDTVVSSPERLALYVKTFRTSLDNQFRPHSDEPVAFVRKLSNALEVMRNLEALHVSQGTSTAHGLPNILQYVHANLTSFHWSGYMSTVSEETNIKADFLRRQDKIEHLVIAGFIDENALQPIAADICPHLRSLSALYPITEILLRGKQYITSLQWVPIPGTHDPELDEDPDADVPSDLGLISSELRRTKYLSYDIIGSVIPVGPSIRRVAPYLASLICLCTHRGIVKYVEALSQLPHLKILVLVAGLYDSWPEEEDLVKVGDSCASLDHIDIEDDNDEFFRFEYDHSSQTLQSYTIDASDTYTWIDNFNAFDQ